MRRRTPAGGDADRRWPGPVLQEWTRALAVCGLVVALDQGAKAAVTAAVSPGDRVDLPLGFRLVDISNNGFAFGAWGGGGTAVVIVAAAALAAVLVWFALEPQRPGLWLGVGLLAGGALGNLADRARTGGVIDFIDPPAWPAFNVADFAITLGALILVFVSLSASRASSREEGARAAPDSQGAPSHPDAR